MSSMITEEPHIEIRIGRQILNREGMPPRDYRIHPLDFVEMVRRLNAKVEGSGPGANGDPARFITLHTSGGSSRVHEAMACK